MKFKRFIYSALSVVALAGLGSCSSSEDIPQIPVQNPLDDQVEYSFSLKLPDEYRTRSAAAPGTVGSDGLYTFSRAIDRIWYAVYVDGKFLYSSEDPLAQQAMKKDDGSFGLVIKLHKEQDPSKVHLFFWAGGKDDSVTTSKTGVPNLNDVNTKIKINFNEGCVSISPKYLNGDNSTLNEFDSFAGYFQLSATATPESFSRTFTLKRPFAQLHILTDELTFPAVAAGYPNGIATHPGFGKARVNTGNVTGNIVNPTTWFYKNGDTMTYSQNDLFFTDNSTAYEFTNHCSGNSPERVTFKGRTMDYLGCYLIFAPQVKQAMKDSSGTYAYFNIGFKDPNNMSQYTEFASVKLPTSGLKANERYVIYNHYVDPTNPGSGGGDDDPEDPDGGGNGGFISNCFTFEITTAPGWDGTVEKEK